MIFIVCFLGNLTVCYGGVLVLRGVPSALWRRVCRGSIGCSHAWLARSGCGLRLRVCLCCADLVGSKLFSSSSGARHYAHLASIRCGDSPQRPRLVKELGGQRLLLSTGPKTSLGLLQTGSQPWRPVPHTKRSCGPGRVGSLVYGLCWPCLKLTPFSLGLFGVQ